MIKNKVINLLKEGFYINSTQKDLANYDRLLLVQDIIIVIMVTFRNNNNNRRNSFRRNTKNFKSNGDNSKFGLIFK